MMGLPFGERRLRRKRRSEGTEFSYLGPDEIAWTCLECDAHFYRQTEAESIGNLYDFLVFSVTKEQEHSIKC
jgi:hypothetical protein